MRLSVHSLLTSQTVYHLRVNRVQVPFSQITQQRSVKTISSPTLPDRYWFMEKTKAKWKTGGGRRVVKSHRSSVYSEQRKIKVAQRAFYELFWGLLNDPSVCLVWFCSFNRYFARWVEDERMGVFWCQGVCALVYVEATCLRSIWVQREEQQEAGVQTPRAPVWVQTVCAIFKGGRRTACHREARSLDAISWSEQVLLTRCITTNKSFIWQERATM